MVGVGGCEFYARAEFLSACRSLSKVSPSVNLASVKTASRAVDRRLDFTMENPKIRAVEAFPVEQQGQTLICLRDPSGLAPEPVMLGMGAWFIVTLFDGRMSLKDIQAAFAKRFGEMIPLEKLDELIAALDGAYFLDSPAFHARERRVREEFLASPDRPAALAGLCYEKDPAKLRLELAAFFDPPDGPGRVP